MPKLPALTPCALIKLLEERGFVLERVKGNTQDNCFSPPVRWLSHLW